MVANQRQVLDHGEPELGCVVGGYGGRLIHRQQHVWRLADGSELALDFTHGLLLRVGAAEPEPERRAPWWAFWRR